MKRLFYIFTIIQLIALPFMFNGLGKVFSSANEANMNDMHPSGLTASSVGSLPTPDTRMILCDALAGAAQNSVQDEIQQMHDIIQQEYSDADVAACPTPTVTHIVRR